MLGDEDFEEYVRIGERNQEIIELTKRHCANAIIEKPAFGGRGMLEAGTGLPLDMRTIRCEYAAHPAPAGMQLEGIALQFWEANCRGCPHREVQGIPNLTTLGEAALADRAVREGRQETERDARERARTERATHARGASPPSRRPLAG